MSTPTFETLKYASAEGVTTISLNRPDRYNAFSDELSFELQDALKAASKDPETRVVVLTGEGKAFCSGQDLKESGKESTRSFSESLHKRYNPIIRRMREMPKPIIGRINGVAAGAGCSLALACDVIVSADHVKFIEVFINIGLVPDSGSSFFLPQLIGYNKAFEMATMGSHVLAPQAYEMGLINKVVPADELDAAVKGYTDYFANAPTRAIGQIKKMLQKAQSSSLNDMLEYEAYQQEIAGRSEDYREGVDAFLEKRKPSFKGK